MEMLYGSGLRVSELCTLERRRVFFDEEYLVVSGKGAKRAHGAYVGRCRGADAPLP